MYFFVMKNCIQFFLYYIIIKFFLHISQDEQKRRLEVLSSDPATEWLVQPEDWKRYEQYDDFLVATEEMLQQTDAEWAPWTIVEATDKNWMRVRVFRRCIERIERELRRRDEIVPEYDEPADNDDGES